jgi:hypothetical protein
MKPGRRFELGLLFRESDIEVTLLSFWPFRHTAARLLHRNSLHLTCRSVGTWNRTNGLVAPAQISSEFEFRFCMSARALDKRSKPLHLKLHVRAGVITPTCRSVRARREKAGTAWSHTMERHVEGRSPSLSPVATMNCCHGG